MGTWGRGVFDSDLACDVRDELSDLVADEVKDPVKRALTRFAEALDDPEDGPVVLLALAAAAWDLGRLDAKLRDRALALAPPALARKLRRKQPKPKKVEKRARHETELEAGDLVALELPSGRWVALVVFDFHEDKGGRYPIVDVLDWTGARRPTARQLAKAKAPHWRRHALCLAGLRSRRDVIARGVPRPKALHLAPAISAFGFDRVARLETTLEAWFKLDVTSRRRSSR